MAWTLGLIASLPLVGLVCIRGVRDRWRLLLLKNVSIGRNISEALRAQAGKSVKLD